MRILLDACVPKGLKRSLVGHDVSTAGEVGWNTLPDGQLLDVIPSAFDVFVTVDRSLPLQRALQGRAFVVILLRARSNRLIDLLTLVPALLRAIDELKPGEMREIGT